MANKTKYFTGLEELHNTEAFKVAQANEFVEDVPVDAFLTDSTLSETSTGRRDFLKFLGFSVSAATLAACETPVIKSIPYVVKPEEITAGVANWYASTYYDGLDYASILVKTREGRPIYIKGNNQYGITGGALNARINSSIMSLYDTARVSGPLAGGEATSWTKADNAIGDKLKAIVEKGGTVRVLTNTINSPSTNAAIDGFVAGLGENASRITYDAISYAGLTAANEKSFGKAIVPSYHFNKAKIVVSIAADFQNSWLLSTKYVTDFAQTRNPEIGTMSRHFQFESVLSLTGSNADVREMVKPSEEGLTAAAIYNGIAKKMAQPTLSINTEVVDAKVATAVKELLENQGASLVVAGSNDVAVQVLVNGINQLLGNYGTTIDLSKTTNIGASNDVAMAQLVKDMKAGKVDALFTYGVNPAYSYPDSSSFIAGLSKVKLSVSFSGIADETASRCQFVLPDNHYLESWNDLEVIAGELALTQPTISPLFDTRQAQQSFLLWSGNNMDFLDFMKENWEETAYASQSEHAMFTDFWNNSVHNGSASTSVQGEESTYANTYLSESAVLVNKTAKAAGTFELKLYTSVAIGDGRHAANPWLQELPDSVTKVTWDNYITMAPSDVDAFGFNTYLGQETPASVAKITINGMSLELPVYPLPGQKPGTIGVALGYGRGADGEEIGKAAYQTGEYGGHLADENGNLMPIGQNVYPLATLSNGAFDYNVYNVGVEATGKEFALAATQTHHTVMGRDSVVKETSFMNFISAPKDDYNPSHTLMVHGENGMEETEIKNVDLWEQHPVENIGHRWGLSIDLSTCIGCNACVTACHSENNVPVVGKDEVRRSRDMHWLRIDRYFSSTEEVKKENGEDFSYKAMEKPEDNPRTVYMPMMCQHCNHAPCETVCPVAATTHSNEGLNQMTYNRCIGTRYCANNCPYKVRRFNWFNYQAYKKFTEVNPAQSDLGRMVLNPDVAVRSRGVMEKCSMCVQKIQAGKLDAKQAGTPVPDGAIQTACSESCPTNAITFGDLNDTNSVIAQKAAGKRAYSSLEEVGTRPNVYYQVKVRNINEVEA
jgi:MoCo/4Fe-4S cofactor protein with predicted Tat translocation signal